MQNRYWFKESGYSVLSGKKINDSNPTKEILKFSIRFYFQVLFVSYFRLICDNLNDFNFEKVLLGKMYFLQNIILIKLNYSDSKSKGDY